VQLNAPRAGDVPPPIADEACVLSEATAMTAFAHRPITTGELRATREGIVVAGESIVTRDEIASANLWPSARFGTFVCIRRRGLRGGIDVQVKNADEGRAVLHALGMDPTQIASELVVAGSSASHMQRRLALYLTTLPLAAIFFLAAFRFLRGQGVGVGVSVVASLPFIALTFGLGLFQMAAPTRVAVGADGVTVRWLWQRRFIPLREIVSAQVVGPEGAPPNPHRSIYTRITLRSGEVIDLCVAMRARGAVSESRRDPMQMRGEMLAERIQQAIDARRAGGDTAWSASALARGDRSTGDWLAWLRDVRTRVATFREGLDLARDELWRIVEDPGAKAEHRAAAAVALATDLDDEGKTKLRVAAQASAAPELRVAMEAAADADDEQLRAALEEIAPARASDAKG
jgi:hypothetical protein